MYHIVTSICINVYIGMHIHRVVPREVGQRVTVCCSVLQCVAVCCIVLQCATVCCSVLQCIAA